MGRYYKHLKRTYGDYSHIKEFLAKPTFGGAKSLWDRSKESRKYQRQYFDKAYNYAQKKYNEPNQEMAKRQRQRSVSRGRTRTRSRVPSASSRTKAMSVSRSRSKTRSRKRSRGRAINDADQNNGVSTLNKTVTYKAQKYGKFYKKLGVQQRWDNEIGIGSLSVHGYMRVQVPGNVMLDRTCVQFLYKQFAKFKPIGAAEIYPDSTAAAHIGVTLYVEEVTSNLRLINQHDTNANFTIYLLQCKNSTASTRTPRDYWEDGMSDLNQGFSSVVAHDTLPGTSPYASKTFNMQWRTILKKNVTLEPGREFNAHFKFKPKRILDLEYTGEYDHVKGLTTRWMICHWGSLGETVQLLDSLGVPEIGPGKYIGTIKNSYKFSLLSMIERQYLRNSDLTVATQTLYTINDETDGGKVIDNSAAT